MRRAVVFLAIGPLAVVATWLAAVHHSGLVDGLTAAILFLFTMTVSAVVGLFDGYLEDAFTMVPRASLSAIAGAIVAYVLVSHLAVEVSGTLRWISANFAWCGAAYASVCSLLANDRVAARAAGGDARLQRSDRSILRGVR